MVKLFKTIPVLIPALINFIHRTIKWGTVNDKIDVVTAASSHIYCPWCL